MQIPSFLSNPALSLICFAGKGGVGKTTSAAATALYLAKNNPQKRFLLASVDPAHSLTDCLTDTNIYENLYVWEIDTQVSFQKFIERYRNTLMKILRNGTFLDEEDISSFFSISLPGIDEVMAMIELAELIENKTYDVIILDTAPAGHTIKFLQMPDLLGQWVHVMDLMMEKHRYLSRLYRKNYQPNDADMFIEKFLYGSKKVECLLKAKSCEFVPVLLAEEISIKETKRLLSVLQSYHIPVHNLIVNRICPASNCVFCANQFSLQIKYITGMKKCFNKYTILAAPLYQNEIHGKELLLQFAEGLTDSLTYTLGSEANTPAKGMNCRASFSIEEEKKHVMIKANSLSAPKSTIEFILFCGKGGVGKTTIASAAALSLAEIYPEKRILLFSTDASRSLSDCLGMSVGETGLSLRNNLVIQEMNERREYEKLKQVYSDDISGFLSGIIKGNATVNVAFEKDIIASLMNITPPGIGEVMALARIIEYMDNGAYDIFILDTAPTGHLIRFLEIPELALLWLKLFFNVFLKHKNLFRMPKLSVFLVDLSKKIKRLLSLLQDGEKSLIIPIAILTDMAWEETKDLLEAIKKLKIPVGQAIINMTHPAFPQRVSDNKCPVCLGRIRYERKLYATYKSLFPGNSLCIMQKEDKEATGIVSLQQIGRKLYGEFYGNFKKTTGVVSENI